MTSLYERDELSLAALSAKSSSRDARVTITDAQNTQTRVVIFQDISQRAPSPLPSSIRTRVYRRLFILNPFPFIIPNRTNLQVLFQVLLRRRMRSRPRRTILAHLRRRLLLLRLLSLLRRLRRRYLLRWLLRRLLLRRRLPLLLLRMHMMHRMMRRARRLRRLRLLLRRRRRRRHRFTRRHRRRYVICRRRRSRRTTNAYIRCGPTLWGKKSQN